MNDYGNPPIFITGYMACGKTTFGRALARQLGRTFIDLDFYIEQRFRMSIKQIFETCGEERFREMEREMLHEAGEMLDVVIACGGGTPCFFDNSDFMLAHGTVVFLRTSPEKIVRRLIINRSRRPLMAGKSEEELLKAVSDGLAARLPYYTRAHITHDGEHLENKRQIASAVARFIENLLPSTSSQPS